MNLIQDVVMDQTKFDQPMEASTRVMRHGAQLVVRLWSMYEAKKQRVGP